ncbi:MAG: hypothetical protein ACR2NB_11145 [Solirubrobacteraceae bacterium]
MNIAATTAPMAVIRAARTIAFEVSLAAATTGSTPPPVVTTWARRRFLATIAATNNRTRRAGSGTWKLAAHWPA